MTTFQVIGSYLWLAWWGRVFGPNWKRQRTSAVHKRNAAIVNATILELQGHFIKVGQLLSIEGLQDRVPPRPFEEIAERVQTELHGKVDELFASFNRTCIASAESSRPTGCRRRKNLRIRRFEPRATDQRCTADVR